MISRYFTTKFSLVIQSIVSVTRPYWALTRSLGPVAIIGHNNEPHRVLQTESFLILPVACLQSTSFSNCYISFIYLYKILQNVFRYYWMNISNHHSAKGTIKINVMHDADRYNPFYNFKFQSFLVEIWTILHFQIVFSTHCSSRDIADLVAQVTGCSR